MAERERINQESINGNENTVPSLANIRQLFVNHIPTANVTDADIKYWVQPVGGEGDNMGDNSCEPRATELATTLKNPNSKIVPRPKTMVPTALVPVAKAWELVDKSLAEEVPTVMRGPATFVGGANSNFKSSHHVILFLAQGEGFYVAYDPDASATMAIRAAWKTANDNATAMGNKNNIISDMVLGTGGQALGPLFRKYYVDKSQGFPKVDPLAGMY